ncbi:MAG: hypothetical protein QGG36_19135 [Pirellulaceae bacterium]|nr:hypothetical protein [Pirellulaceae bacterium]MDP7017928.1 hypothetical protein [Pirellulaceae bacterium]
MNDPFDPYLEWLEIPADRRPPTHYELLGLEELERDQTAVDDGFRQRYAAVRRYQVGEHSRHALRMLTELTKAYDCLSDLQRKLDYDKQLRPDVDFSAQPTAPTVDEDDLILAPPAPETTPLPTPSVDEDSSSSGAEPRPLPDPLWYVRTPDGRRLGPATEAQVRDAADAGRMHPRCVVWRADWSQPVMAHELFPHLAVHGASDSSSGVAATPANAKESKSLPPEDTGPEQTAVERYHENRRARKSLRIMVAFLIVGAILSVAAIGGVAWFAGQPTPPVIPDIYLGDLQPVTIAELDRYEGVEGDIVTIKGSGFANVEMVVFSRPGNAKSQDASLEGDFTVVSDDELRVEIPIGARLAPASVLLLEVHTSNAVAATVVDKGIRRVEGDSGFRLRDEVVILEPGASVASTRGCVVFLKKGARVDHAVFSRLFVFPDARLGPTSDTNIVFGSPRDLTLTELSDRNQTIYVKQITTHSIPSLFQIK